MVICVTVTIKVTIHKRRPKFLYISKGRESETAMVHRN